MKSTEAAFPPRPEVFSVSDMRDHTLRREAGVRNVNTREWRMRAGAHRVDSLGSKHARLFHVHEPMSNNEPCCIYSRHQLYTNMIRLTLRLSGIR